MEIDRNGLEVLGRDECLSLLGTTPLGRLGLSVDALPAVLPVNFVVDVARGRIVLRTAEGAKLRAALHGSVVAFEADDFDRMSHTGWSVLVQGSSTLITEPDELDEVRRLPLLPWANPSTDHWVAVSTELVTGRRVRPWSNPDRPEPVRAASSS